MLLLSLHFSFHLCRCTEPAITALALVRTLHITIIITIMIQYHHHHHHHDLISPVVTGQLFAEAIHDFCDICWQLCSLLDIQATHMYLQQAVSSVKQSNVFV